MQFRFSSVRVILCGAIAALCASSTYAQQAAPRSDEDILKTVKLPEGYEATIFSKAPELGYPTSVSAAVDGTIFVAVDENGSLDRKPKRGRVVRLRDTDGDGRADEQKVFAEMDSPRGVIWDGPNGTGPGTLYVMHPPALTAYTDVDGDGKADKQEDILTGLGFGLDFRGADHTTNGCRLAIDGFIYIAVGDYGYIEAKAKDGTIIKNRGGGIVRIRPDGTGLEIVSRGQRNIYDVAISPTMDIFTRDNTNDGGGWNVRLSHVPPGAHMGYPTLFVNFPEDHLQPLADYGGGSPCGALWLDEPGLPSGLFTVEWGRNAIMRHTLKQKGAGWELDGPNQGQEEWIKLVRPTDMDVDARGALYITSWEGATFNYNGPNAGYVVRVVKKGVPKVVVPDLANAGFDLLTRLLRDSDSAVIRETAQRQCLRLMKNKEDESAFENCLRENNNARIPTEAQFTGLFYTWAQMKTVDRTELSAFVRGNPTALLALADAGKATIQEIKTSLNDGGRNCVAAITAARRLGVSEAAASILPLVADADPVISHLAIRALSEFRASQVCLAALDSADEKVQPGALKALYGMPAPDVVAGLIARLEGAKGELRKGILNALCRLDLVDAPYLDPKEWWGTRPDTSGPVYKPEKWAESEKIEAALKRELDSARGEDARWLTQRMYLTKVSFPGLIEQMLAACGNDAPARLTAIEGLFRADSSLPPEAVKALSEVTANTTESPELRAHALRLLARGSTHGSVFPAATAAFASLAGQEIGQPAITAVFEDFTRDAKNSKWLGDYAKDLTEKDPQRRALAATVLVNLASSTLVKGKDHDAALAAVEKGWSQPEGAAALLGAIARTKSKAFATQVEAHLKDPNNAVAEAALFAHQSLGLGTATGAPQRQIGQMTYDEVFAAVQKGGDPKAGQEMFLRAGCIACHTIDANEPPKGPILSAVAKIYDRAALTESILKPSAKIAQGFESTWVKTKKGDQVEGFVTREGGDSVDVRNIAGMTVTVEKGDIVERGHREQSIMPEGLLSPFTPTELANLLAFLESLKTK